MSHVPRLASTSACGSERNCAFWRWLLVSVGGTKNEKVNWMHNIAERNVCKSEILKYKISQINPEQELVTVQCTLHSQRTHCTLDMENERMVPTHQSREQEYFELAISAMIPRLTIFHDENHRNAKTMTARLASDSDSHTSGGC